MRSLLPPLLVCVLSTACAAGDDVDVDRQDTGSIDASDAAPDVASDATPDGGGDAIVDVVDSSPVDSGGDSGTVDAPKDTGAVDSSIADTGKVDTGTVDTGVVDTGVVDTGVVDTGPVGPITGGPCMSGAPGRTAFRVKWVGSAGSSATVSYEVTGFPVSSGFKVGAYGYSIGFTPAFVDPYLGEGGLQLDGSDFVDVTFSTTGIASIKGATLSIYGRSYNTTASGSFSWQTFEGSAATASGTVSNAAPYKWYAADVTPELAAGKSSDLMRIKAGPPSGALVVSRIELCLDAT